MTEKKSTPFYHSWIPNFKKIGSIDKAVGFDLMISLLEHGAFGTGLNIEDESNYAAVFSAELLFSDYSGTIDRDAEKYEKRCEQNRANASNRKRTLTMEADIDIDIDKDKEIDKDARKRNKNKFKNFDERTYSDEEYAALEGGRR